MKKLNLNIKVSKPIKSEDGKTDMTPQETSVRWIGLMLERAINKPDPRTRAATTTVRMEVQRKYFKVMTALEDAKDGIASVEDDDFNFLDSKYHQAEMPVGRDISEILVAIDDKINEAKVVKKEEKK